jgi:hypothetical protein
MLIHDDGDVTFVSDWNGSAKLFFTNTEALRFAKQHVKGDLKYRVIHVGT